MQFRLLTVLYVFALLAAGMAVFGGWGIVASGVVLFAWFLLLYETPTSLLQWCVLVFILLITLGFMLPDPLASREESRQTACLNNLNVIAMSLLAFHNDHDSLPLHTVRDGNGNDLYSWRVIILKYMDQVGLDEKWDKTCSHSNPKNRVIANTRLDEYQCPSDPPFNWSRPQNNYFAVTGKHTLWPDNERIAIQGISDRPEQTIMLLATASLGSNWAEPKELTFQEALEILCGRDLSAIIHHSPEMPPYFYFPIQIVREGVHAAFADGSVRFLPVPLDEKLARALLTANGGEVIPPGTLDALTEPRLNYARIYGLCVFVVLTLLPGVVLWRRRSRTSLPEAVVRS